MKSASYWAAPSGKISSIANKEELDLRFVGRAKKLELIPDAFLRFFLVWIGPLHAKQGTYLTSQQYKDLGTMAREIDLKFFRWAVKATLKWSRALEEDKSRLQPRYFRIHGENDSVIPFPKEQADWILAKAGHLITYSHANILAAKIRE